MSRSARFELVRTGAGWHVRFRASNGRIVLSSEVYTRRLAALKAVRIVARAVSPTARIWVETVEPSIRFGHPGDLFLDAHKIEVREVDER